MRNKAEEYHALFFSVITALQIELSFIAYTYFPLRYFFVIASFFFLIFFFEVYFSFKFAMELKNRLTLPYIFDDLKHIHISHHILLPLFLYAGIIAYICLNGASLLTQLFIIISIITFYSIYKGQRTSFSHDFLFDEYLHYVYDSIKIIIYFLCVDSITQAFKLGYFGSLVLVLATQVLSFILFLLIITRKHQLNTGGILYIFMASLITSLFILLASYLPISSLILAMIASVIYYLFVGLIHHKLNASLTPGVLLEYIVIAGIILLALSGISF